MPCPLRCLQDATNSFTALASCRFSSAIQQALGERRVLTPLENVPYYPGRSILVTANDHGLRLYNGDVGVIWPNDEGQLRAWFRSAGGDGLRALSPHHLPEHETVYAMTIHKSQGSEFDRLLLLSAGANVLQEAAGRAVQRDSGLASRLG